MQRSPRHIIELFPFCESRTLSSPHLLFTFTSFCVKFVCASWFSACKSGSESPTVTMTMHTILDWAKCSQATYWEYPGLYDLLDTPKHVFYLPSYIYAILHFLGLYYPNLEAHYPSSQTCSFAAPSSPSHPNQSSVCMYMNMSIH